MEGVVDVGEDGSPAFSPPAPEDLLTEATVAAPPMPEAGRK